MKKMNKRLCIIGSAPSKKDAPYSNTSYDIWATSGAIFSDSLGGNVFPIDNNKWNDVTRVDAFFEMHTRDKWEEKYDLFTICDKPIVMLRKEEEIPTSEAYPVEKIARDVGDEFSSSIAYMFALAIYAKYEEIRFYGVNLMHESEYASQRPAFKYYLAIARERGIKAWAPDETRLVLSPDRYGYTNTASICGDIEARKQELEKDMNDQKQAVEDARQKFFQLRGAAQDCADILQSMKARIA